MREYWDAFVVSVKSKPSVFIIGVALGLLAGAFVF